MNCRHCHTPLTRTFVDLGAAPPSNAYLKPEDLSGPETWYPLRVLVCEECWLVQTEDFAAADELFSPEYAYFSGVSSSWIAHTERYAEAMIARFGLGSDSRVVEVASNDGSLLEHFKDRGVPCLGIEPTASTAAAAWDRGIEAVEEFFGLALAESLVAREQRADLTAANNVLAHVPDINDFIGGFAHLLNPQGVATFEFPHLLRLVAENQFDTIYHEHFSYLSLIAVERAFKANGLSVFDVEELPTHGGSLRVLAQRSDTGRHVVTPAVEAMRQREEQAGLHTPDYYADFQPRAEEVKDALLRFLLDAKQQGKRVAAYGAAAKGNTLLNFAGIRPDLIDMVADRNPAKQGKYMPGSRIPIRTPEEVLATQPDYVLILPWNIADEVREQWSEITQWGGQFVTAVPALRIT